MLQLEIEGDVPSVADDTVILHTVTFLDRNTNVEHDLKNKVWFDEMGLTLNIEETKWMTFTSKKNTLPNK